MIYGLGLEGHIGEGLLGHMSLEIKWTVVCAFGERKDSKLSQDSQNGLGLK